MELGQTLFLTTTHGYYEVGQIIAGKVYLYKVLSKEKMALRRNLCWPANYRGFCEMAFPGTLGS